LRVLPRLYEEASPAEIRRWFAAGTAVAAENAAAGRAYFALESRTSLSVLRAAATAAALEDTQGVWRKVVQMLSGEPVVVRGVDVATLRLPLEDLPAEHEVALPLRIDWLPTHEDNCRVYRLLAAALAGRREFGTYARPDLRACVRRPELLEDLFLLAEGVRVHHRLAANYPGLAGEAGAPGTDDGEAPPRDPAALELASTRDEEAASGHPLSADELRRLLEVGAKIGQGSAEHAGGGLPITALMGKIPAAQLEALRQALGDAEPAAARRAPAAANHDHAFFYDEWDHLIGDYRSRWCRLTEVGLAGDAGEFFGQTLADYARLLPEVRRQFQRI